MVCLGLWKYHGPPDIVDVKGSDLAMGTQLMACLSKTKDLLCVALALLFQDPKLPDTMMIDASGTIAGGIIMQDHGECVTTSHFP